MIATKFSIFVSFSKRGCFGATKLPSRSESGQKCEMKSRDENEHVFAHYEQTKTVFEKNALKHARTIQLIGI